MAVADQIDNAESGGDPNAKNPNSSASGPGQFIDSTFLSVLKQHHPDIAQGQSDDDLLALKNDPVLGKQLTADYAGDNQAVLSNAGLPVNAGTTYLAHFAGPQGAVGILNSDPSAPASSVLGPAAMKANPFLAGMSAGDVAAWANRKMGGAAPMSMAGPAAPVPAPAAPVPQQPQAAPQQSWTPGPVAPASAASLAALAAVPKLANILPARRGLLPGMVQMAPFSLGG